MDPPAWAPPAWAPLTWAPLTWAPLAWAPLARIHPAFDPTGLGWPGFRTCWPAA